MASGGPTSTLLIPIEKMEATSLLKHVVGKQEKTWLEDKFPKLLSSATCSEFSVNPAE